MTIVALVVAGGLYALGVRRAAARGVAWSRVRIAAFYALGLGSYALVELGFLGVYSGQLRWAFTARIALLLLAIPGLVTLGRPLELVRAGLGDAGQARFNRIMNGRLARILGNAVVATLLVALIFCIFLTPIAGMLRTTPWLNEATGPVTAAVGLVLVLPLMALTGARSSTFLAIEFLLAFAELVIDSIPGILVRLNDTILDHAPAIASGAAWRPNPLHDQHLAGDLLWFIAEVADVPVLLMLLIRWVKRDRVEAQSFDELTDEEHDALVQAHLRGDRAE